jgi:hypothetical protein
MDTNNPNTYIINYDNDTGVFNDNNISQHTLCTSRYMHVTPHSYILCIPRVPYTATKMDLARAVENQIISSGKGRSTEIENFEYVKNVTFVRAFDQVEFDRLTSSRSLGSSSFGVGSGSKECYRDPWYKIALVIVDIPPRRTENGAQIYTNGEDAFYNGVCRGDIVINSWTDAFFVAHPRSYFQHQQQQQQQQQEQPQKKSEKNQEKADVQGSAFQKWNYEYKLRQLERKVKEHENTIRQYELELLRTQDTVNEFAESIRFLTRQRLDSSELCGLNCTSNGLTSYLPALNNRYSRVCVSDTTFLEINRNMKLKQMNGHVISACDDCDVCQEMIHSIDHARPEERDQLFADIEQMICRVNKGVQRFEKLHLNAERSLFGLRNRKVLEDFGAYLNTALEIVEEVTSRVSTFTQDLEYAKCYGQLFRCNDHQHEQYAYHCGTSALLNYDYAEDADQVYDEDHSYNNDNAGIESTQQMLHYFDDHNQELYKQQQQEEEKQQQEEEESEASPVLSGGIAYHEEAVIIEGQEDAVNVNGSETVTVAESTTETVVQETQQKKKSGWLWF